MKFKILWILLYLTVSVSAQAQWQDRHALSVDYSYCDFRYKEPGVMTESGRLSGVRGQLSLNVAGPLFIFGEGQYFDGNLEYEGSTFSGTPITTTTKDWIRTLGVGAGWIGANYLFSVGFAQRYWYDNLVISYRRRTQYEYFPIKLALNSGPYYLLGEYRHWQTGENKSHMSDVSNSRTDVEMKQNDGVGYLAELGMILQSYPMSFKLALSYQRWDVKQSEIGFDGVDYLVEPKNQTEIFELNVGVLF